MHDVTRSETDVMNIHQIKIFSCVLDYKPDCKLWAIGYWHGLVTALSN